MNMTRADEWRSRGGHFSWRPAGDTADPVQIFHVELGDPGAPVLLLVHGWPTSSIDWFEVASQLSARFRVCALDFPGYGFSAKPRAWGYSLGRDEELIEYYLAAVIGADAAVIAAHDRGDSVALLHAARCADGRSATRAGAPGPVQRQPVPAAVEPDRSAAADAGPGLLARGRGRPDTRTPGAGHGVQHLHPAAPGRRS